MKHISVLLDQVIHYLEPKNSSIYVDCTFGNGGYSEGILQNSANNHVIAIDQDPNALETANLFKTKYQERFTFVGDNFANLADILKPFGAVDGIVWDLGVSSMQLDNAKRGFSFTKQANLDMRMSCQGFSAADFVNSAKEEELADVIFYNGDETNARKIARKIVEMRQLEAITTTMQLAQIVRSVVRTRNFSIDAATKTFQAIRIYVNDELGALEKSLAGLDSLLNKDGKIVFVSFHSLEDSIIKNYLKTHSAAKVARSKYHPAVEQQGIYQLLTKKAITPSRLEVSQNPRSRSAKLRAAQKI
jgi:16S rRNA (cytosine1402-N4)-methyltransferase